MCPISGGSTSATARAPSVPLQAIASLRTITGPQVITRYNNYRSVTVNGIPAPGVASGTALAAMADISAKTLAPGFGFEWTGTAFQEQRAGGQTGIVLGMALLFAFLFLVGLYESWMIPVPVLLSVVTAVLGAFAGGRLIEDARRDGEQRSEDRLQERTHLMFPGASPPPGVCPACSDANNVASVEQGAPCCAGRSA